MCIVNTVQPVSSLTTAAKSSFKELQYCLDSLNLVKSCSQDGYVSTQLHF